MSLFHLNFRRESQPKDTKVVGTRENGLVFRHGRIVLLETPKELFINFEADLWGSGTTLILSDGEGGFERFGLDIDRVLSEERTESVLRENLHWALMNELDYGCIKIFPELDSLPIDRTL
jgi:hypothetical protein